MTTDARDLLLSALLDQSPAFIAAHDPDGFYLYANAPFARALGATPDAIVGRRTEDFMAPADLPAFLRAAGGADDGEPSGAHVEDGVHEGKIRHFLVTRFPLRAGGTVFAVGIVATPLDDEMTALDVVHSSLHRAEAANAELRRALERMERLAYTDRLTGAWNRRYVDDAAVVEMSRTERHGYPVSMLVIDIDHFKKINDRFGHPVGDDVLSGLVRCVRAGMRRGDTITRWGGEEFIVLAPDTPLRDAARLADKLCERVGSVRLCESMPEPVTVSIGVAEYQVGEGFDAWMARGDRALYRAKVEGRNRVVSDPASAFGSNASCPAGVVKLLWRETYSSGDAEVDRQHRALFEHVNRLLDAVLTGAPRESVLGATRVLVEEIAEHFADEEALHERIAYPDRATHAEEHGKLLDKALDLLDAAMGGVLAPAELFQFLAHDVVAIHLLGSDRRYFPYLGMQGEHAGT